jgi:PBP1b-binding outer membrane lipoprotein LpoB
MKGTFLLLLLSFTLLIASCSDGEEDKKSAIDSFTEETAQKAVQHIQAPLDKARAVQKLVDKHSDEIEKGSGE